MPRTGRAAAAAAWSYVGKAEYHLMCKMFVGTAVFGADPSTSPTAIAAWEQARWKHPQRDPEKYPAFVPAYMDTSNTAEHVLFTIGRDHTGHRLAISTDAGPGHTIAVVRLADLSSFWGPMIGWAEDINAQRVWDPRPMIRVATLLDAAAHDGDRHGDRPLHPIAVGIVERALVAERLLSPSFVNGYFGPRKRHAYAAWQQRTGYPATGMPELGSLARLGVLHHFDAR